MSDSVSLMKGILFTQPRHFKGRAPCGDFWKMWVTASLLYLVACLVVNSIDGNARIVVLELVGSMIGICTVPVTVRRLHDLGYSGKAMIPSVCFPFVYIALVLFGNDASFVCALVGIIATVYNLFLFVLLGCFRGTKGTNKYGPDPLETISCKEKIAMEETDNVNGAEESNATVPRGAEATAEEIRKAKELLRANGYWLVAYRVAGETVKRTVGSGLDFVKGKCKALGGWFSAKRAALKARQEERRLVAAEKRRLAEEAEARRAEAESARVGTIAESQSVGSDDVPKCAACGAALVPGARFCRKCGKPVSSVVPDTSTAEQPVEAKPMSASDGNPAGSAAPQCAECGAELVLGARFIRKCGKPVSVVPDTSVVEPPAEAKPVSATVDDSAVSDLLKCVACGAVLLAGMKFCGECGTSVNAGVRKPRKRKTTRPSKNNQKGKQKSPKSAT